MLVWAGLDGKRKTKAPVPTLSFLSLILISFIIIVLFVIQMAEAADESVSKKGSESTGFGMWATIKMMRAKFPKVKDVTTETLQGLLQPQTNQEDKKVVLLVSSLGSVQLSLAKV